MPMPLGSAYQLGTATTQYMDVVRKSNWEVVIAAPGMANLSMVCASVTIPDTTLEQVEIYHFNERVRIASKPNPQKLEIEIYDYVPQTMFTALWNWYNLVYNPNTGVIGYASTYKYQGQINLIDVTGAAVRTWYCMGLWPTTAPVPSGNLTYEDMNAVRIKMSLSCDRVSINPAINQAQSGT